MNRTIQWLALLLGIQLLVALGLHFTGPDLAPGAARVPLLAFDRERVDRLRLEGPEQAVVTLEKGDAGWTLKELEGFPADTTKVDQLLARLAELQGGIPAATSAAAQPRFRVSDQDFERRIGLFAGDQALGTLYLGSSPGMGQIHARAGDSERIEVVELAAFDIPVKADDWIDRLLVRVPREQITAIEIAGLRIERVAATEGDEPRPRWQATGLAEGEQLNQQAADTLADRLAELSIGAVLGRDAKAEYGLDQPALTLTVVRTGGESFTYRIGKSAGNPLYTLQASSRPEYFRIPSYTAEQLLEAATRGALLAPEKAGETAPPAAHAQAEDAEEEAAGPAAAPES
ncbi:MAG: DUF4340 domain-containing protein [Pseudomonadota bacterium]